MRLSLFIKGSRQIFHAEQTGPRGDKPEFGDRPSVQCYTYTYIYMYNVYTTQLLCALMLYSTRSLQDIAFSCKATKGYPPCKSGWYLGSVGLLLFIFLIAGSPFGRNLLKNLSCIHLLPFF